MSETTQAEAQTIVKGTPAELVADPERNFSRHLTVEQREGEVKERAIDIARNGQTQPVRCFKPRGNSKPNVYIGFTRHAAVALLNAGFEVEDGTREEKAVTQDEKGNPVEVVNVVPNTVKYHLPDLLLDYVVDDIPEEEAARRGLVDNFKAFKPSDIDIAHAAKRLKDRYGYTDVKIGEILNIPDPTNKVREVSKLLGLPAVIQDAVHDGRVATSAALEAVKAESKTGKPAAVKFLKDKIESAGGGKVKATALAVRKAAEDAVEAKERAAATPEGSKPAPAPQPVPQGSQIRSFFQALLNGLAYDDKVVQECPEYLDVIGAINRWVHGQLKEKTLIAKLDEAFNKVKDKPKPKRGKGKGPAGDKSDAPVAEGAAA